MFFIEQDTTDCWFLYMSTSWNILLYSRKYFLCFFAVQVSVHSTQANMIDKQN